MQLGGQQGMSCILWLWSSHRSHLKDKTQLFPYLETASALENWLGLGSLFGRCRIYHHILAQDLCEFWFYFHHNSTILKPVLLTDEQQNSMCRQRLMCFQNVIKQKRSNYNNNNNQAFLFVD